jgi:hypothetical protein
MSFPTPAASQPDGYHAYLMRLWQAGSNGTWRLSLQCVQTGEKLHFASLESLFTYLQAQSVAGDGDVTDTMVDDEHAAKVVS